MVKLCAAPQPGKGSEVAVGTRTLVGVAVGATVAASVGARAGVAISRSAAIGVKVGGAGVVTSGSFRFGGLASFSMITSSSSSTTTCSSGSIGSSMGGDGSAAGGTSVDCPSSTHDLDATGAGDSNTTLKALPLRALHRIVLDDEPRASDDPERGTRSHDVTRFRVDELVHPMEGSARQLKQFDI